MQRNAVYAALLSQLNALTTAQYDNQVAVVSRGFVAWDQADIQPAIYIVPVTEEAQYKRGLPTKYVFKIDLYVYVRWTDSVEQGVLALAGIMDSIDTILSPLGPNGGIASDNGFVNNLGGIAVYCALQGTADISGGFLAQSQTVARMPVEVMAI